MGWANYAVFEDDRYVCMIRAASKADARWRVVYRPTPGVPVLSEDEAAGLTFVRDNGDDVT